MFVQRSRVLGISLVAIFSAFVVEFVFGLASNSLGLITDSIHALLDSVVTIVLLLAARLAIKPPDEEHTYGHGKVESLGGLIGGIAIFLIAIFLFTNQFTDYKVHIQVFFQEFLQLLPVCILLVLIFLE